MRLRHGVVVGRCDGRDEGRFGGAHSPIHGTRNTAHRMRIAAQWVLDKWGRKFANYSCVRASITTLGCRLNQAESLNLQDKLQAAGYEVVPWGEAADLGIINTCTVTRQAESKCRQVIRKFVRENPQAFTAVIGCYSQTGAEALSRIAGIDLIVGNQDKMSVLDFARVGEKNERPIILRDRINPQDFTMTFAGELPYPKRANLKIQDGCDFLCSFCIIPFARGRARSRDWDNMLEEARSLTARGVRELVLTGVNIGLYESGGRKIVDLVDALDALPDLWRIRISSIEPTTVPLELIDRMASPRHKLMPYLHLPLQAGNDETLRNMRRRYTVAEYLEFVSEAMRRAPGLCLGTDIMVGFPGESEAQFEETCQVFLDAPFSYCHVFPYSERDGTLVMKKDYPAVPREERMRRANHLRRLSAKKLYDWHAGHVGQITEVLFEDPREDIWPGLTKDYVRVVTRSELPLRNRLAKVRLTEVTADFMSGEVLELTA